MTPTPDNTKAKMKTKKWEEEFDKKFKDNWFVATEGKNDVRCEQIKSFIQELLDSQRAELLEAMVVLSDKIELEGNTTLEEWKAFKRFRNTVRDLLSKGTLEQLDKGER